MKNKPVVGQLIHILLTGNAARHKKGTERITSAKVDTVGRKYFTLVGYSGIQFTLDGKQVCRYGPDYGIFESRQEILDILDKERIARCFSEVFKFSVPNGISADAMRQMHALLPLNLQVKLCSDG